MSILAIYLPLAFASGCTPESKTSSSTEEDAADLPPVWVDCLQNTDEIDLLFTEITDVPTVPRVSWETTEDGEGWLAVRGEDGSIRVTSAVAQQAGPQETLLTGLKPGVEVDIQAVLRLPNGDEVCSAVTRVETGRFDASLPATMGSGLASNGESTLVSVLSESSVYVAVINEEGETVWAHRTWFLGQPGDEMNMGGPPVAFRTRLDPHGRGVLYNVQGAENAEMGDFVTVGWSGEVLDLWSIPTAHTDFDLLPDGRLVTLGWSVGEFDGRRILGDTLVVRETDGSTRVLWDIFDHLTPDLGRIYPNGFSLGGQPTEDWSHANGLSCTMAENACYVTVTEPSLVARIALDSGEVSWMLGRGQPDFAGDGAMSIEMPHSVQAMPDGILVFNRTMPSDPTTCSTVLEIELEPEAHESNVVWSWDGGFCAKNNFLGNAWRLGSGNTFTTWSSLGHMDEVTPDGEVVWSVDLAVGAGFGFGTRIADLPGSAR